MTALEKLTAARVKAHQKLAEAEGAFFRALRAEEAEKRRLRFAEAGGSTMLLDCEIRSANG